MKAPNPIVVIIIALLALAGGYSIGIGLKPATIEYRTVYLQSPVQTVTEKSVILRVVRQTEYRDRPAYGKDLRQFQDYYELKNWLSKNWVEDMGGYECVAEALEMQRRAYDDGYLVSTQALFWGAREKNNISWHMVNSTVIGRNIWFFDPVERIIWKAGHAAGKVERG